METYKLRDLCLTEISDGTHQTPTYSETGYIFLSSKNVTTGKIDWDNVMYIPESLHNELYKRIKPQRDDILLAKNGTTGVAAIVDRDEVFDIYVSLALIRPDKSKVLPRYLLYAINSTPSKEFFNSNLKGIGVPNLHLKHIRETPIRVPSFKEQKHIISVLDKVTDLLDHRTQQLAELDELVKSRFIELFGSVEDNVFGLETIKIKDACDLINGKAFKPEDWSDEGLPIVRIQNLNNEHAPFNFFNGEIKEQYLIDTGELLFSWSGTPGTSFGAFFWNRGKAVLNQHIFRVKPKIEFNLSFLQFALNGRIDYIISKAHGGVGLQHITKKELDEVELLLPALDRQSEFAAFVEQTDKAKLAVQNSIAELEELKKSLMQKYFG
jgi:type I restriction enzyme S subunit